MAEHWGKLDRIGLCPPACDCEQSGGEGPNQASGAAVLRYCCLQILDLSLKYWFRGGGTGIRTGGGTLLPLRSNHISAIKPQLIETWWRKMEIIGAHGHVSTSPMYSGKTKGDLASCMRMSLKDFWNYLVLARVCVRVCLNYFNSNICILSKTWKIPNKYKWRNNGL